MDSDNEDSGVVAGEYFLKLVLEKNWCANNVTEWGGTNCSETKCGMNGCAKT